MKVNGKILLLECNQSLFEFLQVQNYDLSKIAIELNGEIIPKSSYEKIMLKDQDTLEIVQFVGGG